MTNPLYAGVMTVLIVVGLGYFWKTEDTRFITYNCNGEAIAAARHDVKGEAVELSLSDGVYLLEHVPAASGAKYSDGDVMFWSQGDQATIERSSDRARWSCLAAARR